MSDCVSFWLEDPRILLIQASEFFPFTENDRRCTSSALNSFTRFGLYLGVLLSIVRMEPIWLLVGVVFALFSAGAWMFMEKSGAIREGFSSDLLTTAPIIDPRDVMNEYVPDIIGSPATNRTFPTTGNPFMNVLLTEISDNPTRNPAANVQNDAIKTELDGYFQTMFASDPGDVFNKTQGQRTWVTMPSSTIPNDQGAFADWLFRVPGQTCKEGNLSACVFNTGAETLPWREMRKLT